MRSKLLLARAVVGVIQLGAAGCGDSRAAPRPGESAAPPPEPVATVVAAAPAAPATETLTLSAVGDCTLGSSHDTARAPGSFNFEMDRRGEDWRYPFSGTLEVLAHDDLTIANLETTLTNAPPRSNAPFAFKGKPEYARILAEGSVELVTVANNHSHDAGFAGYDDTVAAVRSVGVGVFGNGMVDRRVVKGIEVVNLGYLGGLPGTDAKVARDVAQHKTPDNIVIVSCHWGIEGFNAVNPDQQRVGHSAVDAGADLVLGHHPHVLQGIEEYRGKRIVYSLGNFVFGGHSQPEDMDSMIFQEIFELEGGHVARQHHRIVPVRISTATDHNDFRPVLFDGADRERVLGRIDAYTKLLPHRPK